MAVGAQPNIELAERAGLATEDGGVLVDASLRTSYPDIYAVGDIAAAEHPLFERRIRTEHWATALNQPEVAVAGMLGEAGEYKELPYFFTDQYDLGMEYVGHAPRLSTEWCSAAMSTAASSSRSGSMPTITCWPE